MSQLIDDLLAFSRIGRTQMRKAPIDLNALVKDFIAELQPETKNRKVAWTLEKLPYISGDRSLLHQVLTNLLANAVKYTRTRAEANIQVFAVEQDDEIIVGVEVRLSIQPADAEQARIADGRTACRKSGGPAAISRE